MSILYSHTEETQLAMLVRVCRLSLQPPYNAKVTLKQLLSADSPVSTRPWKAMHLLLRAVPQVRSTRVTWLL